MHYECRNNECPKFRTLVKTRTAANYGYECRICYEKLKAIWPPTKRDYSKVLRIVNNSSGAGGKFSVRKKSARKRGSNKLIISKNF
jgi:hypothetical protein